MNLSVEKRQQRVIQIVTKAEPAEVSFVQYGASRGAGVTKKVMNLSVENFFDVEKYNRLEGADTMETKELTEKVETLQNENKELTDKVEALETEKTELSEKVDALSSEKTELTEKVGELESIDIDEYKQMRSYFIDEYVKAYIKAVGEVSPEDKERKEKAAEDLSLEYLQQQTENFLEDAKTKYEAGRVFNKSEGEGEEESDESKKAESNYVNIGV